jgi:glycine oxidase
VSSSDTSDVLIIGGGVIGLTCALELAKRGVSVSVLERGRCGRAASWAAAGVLKPCSWHRKSPMATLQRDSLLVFEAFAAELRDRTGITTQYEKCGGLTLNFDEQQHRMALSDATASAAFEKGFGGRIVEVLDAKAARAREPGLNPEIVSATYCRVTAQVRPPRLLRALLAACIGAGVKVSEAQEVAEIVYSGTRAIGVKLSRGTRHAGIVLDAAGAWASELLWPHSNAVPVYPVRGQVVLLEMLPRPFTHVLTRGKCYLISRDDGRILLGATEEHEAGFSEVNTAEGVAGLLHAGISLLPAVRQAPIIRMWSGLRPGTPDRRPYIGFVPGTESLFVAAGHYRTGIILAPVTGRIVADLITKGSTEYDISGCRTDRSVADKEPEDAA